MSDEERLSVRLSSDDILILKELVYRKEFDTESDAVREAIRLLIDSRFTKEELEKILSEAKSRADVDISMFIKDGSDAGQILGRVIERGLGSDREDD